MHKFDADVVVDLRKLVTCLTSLDERSTAFRRTYSGFEKQLARLNAPFVEQQHDVDVHVASIAEKFRFHGFGREAAMLDALYNKYIASYTSREDLHHKLATVKLLLALSISPTRHLASLDNAFQCTALTGDEEIIDWVAHLQDGVDLWRPNFDATDDSSEYSDCSTVKQDNLQIVAEIAPSRKTELDLALRLHYLREAAVAVGKNDKSTHFKLELQQNLQHSWWNAPVVRDLPSSLHEEANIALRWEAYRLAKGHEVPPMNILSQYKVIREILWQMDGPHNSVVFAWRNNALIVNDNVTIPSLRPFVFKPMIETFLRYIHQLHTLRTFHQRTIGDTHAPHTFCAYAEAVMDVVRSVERRIHAMAAQVAQQERTMTLLKLEIECGAIFPPIEFLCNVHERAVLDLGAHAPHHCAIHLLTTLHAEMAATFVKTQMDVLLALYVDAVFAYMRIIEDWFRRDRLLDAQNEFPIMAATDGATYELRASAIESPLLALIASHVIPIGRQIRLLRRLNHLHLLHAEDFEIYAPWKRHLLDDVCRLPPKDGGMVNDNDCAAMQPDVHPFLRHAFEAVLKTSGNVLETAASTYETLTKMAEESYAPVERNVIERMRTLLTPLRRHVGDALRHVLVDVCALAEHVDVLWTVFLFRDDVIGAFYRRVFSACAGDDVWLTHHLRDALADAHPMLADRVAVVMRAPYVDALGACASLAISYRLTWPIDMVVGGAHALHMYREIFAFVLQIKWALHTLHQMAYARAHVRRMRTAPQCVRTMLKRLQVLRFGFTCIFSALQHYVLGYAFNVCRQRYVEEFAHAHDIDAIAAAHNAFIGDLHRVCARVRDYDENEYGIIMALYYVQKLHKMWTSPGNVQDKELKKIEDGLHACHNNILDVWSYEVFELL